MGSPGGIYKGPGGEQFHGDGRPVNTYTPHQKTVTHIAGPFVRVGSRSIQRCAVCGVMLRDSNTEPPQGPGEQRPFVVYRGGEFIRVFEDGRQVRGELVTVGAYPADGCGLTLG